MTIPPSNATFDPGSPGTKLRFQQRACVVAEARWHSAATRNGEGVPIGWAENWKKVSAPRKLTWLAVNYTIWRCDSPWVNERLEISKMMGPPWKRWVHSGLTYGYFWYRHVTPPKSNIATQNSHVWKVFQTIMFGIYVSFLVCRFLGNIFLWKHGENSPVAMWWNSFRCTKRSRWSRFGGWLDEKYACFPKIGSFTPKWMENSWKTLLRWMILGVPLFIFVSKWNYDVRATCVSVRSFRGGEGFLWVGYPLDALVMAPRKVCFQWQWDFGSRVSSSYY